MRRRQFITVVGGLDAAELASLALAPIERLCLCCVTLAPSWHNARPPHPARKQPVLFVVRESSGQALAFYVGDGWLRLTILLDF
jgi:hypothetical protein